MHWLLSVRRKFYVIIGCVLSAFLMGVLFGQFAFSRVQVGGTLYKGIHLKRDVLSALSTVRTDLALLQGNLYAAALWDDDESRGRTDKLMARIQVDLQEIRNMESTSHDEENVSCSACHSAEILEAVFSPVQDVVFRWETLQRMLQTTLSSGWGTEPAALMEGEVSTAFAAMLEEIESSEEMLLGGVPLQYAAIAGEADLIRKGFIAGGVAMTIILLGGAVALLKHAAGKISLENKELLAAAMDLQRISEEQASKIDFIAEATAEVSLAIDEVARTTKDALEASQDASEIAVYGKQTSGYTLHSIKNGAVVIKEAAEIIASLEKRSREIANIVSTINTIAMQTNLLALNAAVEAARAGEHGKGFSVVAEEVQNLAARTKQATSEIEEMIKFVLAETARSMESITKSKDEAEKSVKLVDAVSQSFESIVAASGKTSGMVGQIAEFASKRSKTTEEISGNIREIADIHKAASEAANRLHRFSA